MNRTAPTAMAVVLLSACAAPGPDNVVHDEGQACLHASEALAPGSYWLHHGSRSRFPFTVPSSTEGPVCL